MFLFDGEICVDKYITSLRIRDWHLFELGGR